MLGFRIASPLGWLAALILFFSPWVDISCRWRDGSVQRTTISGAQLAWGGETERDDGRLKSWVLHNPSRMLESAARAFTGILLTGYLFVLVWGIRFAIKEPPGRHRGRTGCKVALGLFALLASGVWVSFGHPFPPLLLNESPITIHDSEFDLRFTAWYFGSYLANLWAVVCFAVEYWRSRRCAGCLEGE